MKIYAITRLVEIIPDKHYGADEILGYFLAEDEETAQAKFDETNLDDDDWFIEECGDLVDLNHHKV